MIISKEFVASLLEACRSIRQLIQIHGLMISTAFVKDIVLLSRLVDFCIDIGDLDYARSLFLRIEKPSVFIWNSMIRGFSGRDLHSEAISFYREMLAQGYKPDSFTFPSMLRSCAATVNSALCGCVHGRIVKSGYVSDIYASTSLIHSYGASRDIHSAQKMFDEMSHKNTVTWTAMMAGYADAGKTRDAIRLLKEMELAGVVANEVTMATIFAASAKTRDLELGRMVLTRFHLLGFLNLKSNIILATAVIDMYARCGSLVMARKLFDEIPSRNVTSWNAMLTAYNQYERYDQAAELFKGMRRCGIVPDKVTLLGLMGSCAGIGNQDLGREIHALLEKAGYSQDDQIQTSLSHMYAKSGDSKTALEIFHRLRIKDVVAWTGMITGLGSHGRGREAVSLFEAMKREGVAPDGIAFVGILSACSHSGFVEEGCQYFKVMKSFFGLSPSLQHYGCMVDLLSRAGKIAEAEKLIVSMAVLPSMAIWSALLSGCQIHDTVEAAEQLWQRVEELSPASSGVFVLLSNLYAAQGMWDGVRFIRELMRQQRVEKQIACCVIGG